MKAGTDTSSLVPPLTILALGLVFCLLALHEPVGDYGNYYFGSKLWLHHAKPANIAEPWTFNELVRSQPGMQQEKFFLNYAAVPPFSLVFYIPFTVAPVYISKLIFSLFSLLVFSFSFFRLLKRYPQRTRLVWLIPFIFILPLKSNIYSGQSYLLITACLIEGFLADGASRSWRASCWFALAIVLKIFPVFVLLYLLIQKRIKTLVITAGCSFILVFLGMSLTGWSSGVHYFSETVPRLFRNEINNPYAINYQSVFVFLKTVFVRDALLNPAAPFDLPLGFEIFIGVFTGLLFYFTVQGIRKNENQIQAYSMAILFGMLSTAYASVYSLLLLIIPAVSLAGEKRNSRHFLLVVCLFLICLISISGLTTLPWPLQFLRLYLLLLFFTAFAFPLLNPIRFRWLIVSCVLFVSLRMSVYTGTESDLSDYYLHREEALLIGDYRVEKDSLILDYLNDEGFMHKSLACRDSVFASPLLEVKDGQVYYNKRQVTRGSGRNREPALLNDTEIIYLSDRDRGVGFYTLRKIFLK